jgi:valacyclovir hydrolase, putative
LLLFLGGHYALLFASVYSTLIKRTISIDMVKPISFKSEGWREAMSYIIDKHIETEELYLKEKNLHLKAPRHSEESAISKMMESHGHSLTKESAKLLLQRGSKWMDDGLVFTRDIRLKLPPLDPMPSVDDIYNIMEGIRCDLLVILAEQSLHVTPEKIKSRFFEMYENNCRLFKSSLLPGSHHIHMNNPDIVGKVINEFIKESLQLDKPSTENDAS